MHLSFQLADLLLGDWRQRGKLNRGGSGVLSPDLDLHLKPAKCACISLAFNGSVGSYKEVGLCTYVISKRYITRGCGGMLPQGKF